MSQEPIEPVFYQAFVRMPWFCSEHREWLFEEPEPVTQPRTSRTDTEQDLKAFKEKMLGEGGEWAADYAAAIAARDPVPSFSIKQIWPVVEEEAGEEDDWNHD
ncbi:hypothetical protein A2765_06015 [Candidatus Kaiserbacteria bacterium RIFCSPHIGHO2_01_FULL_56_24]|uniref:Uncharacterized protein n=1 Tax=Candidatus Kaiserbacteria bacterium RIFCSPHIGHO2_01_FULL_56_24 TaxID=1798487 RepID=A0A1F6D8G3_9BACT|nr:MAG: hypothetical protein A2765_06015 [Candidatus Kaiserbacteria bacterium RIFCSPHIGHO2_01_FULL_56_24]